MIKYILILFFLFFSFFQTVSACTQTINFDYSKRYCAWIGPIEIYSSNLHEESNPYYSSNLHEESNIFYGNSNHISTCPISKMIFKPICFDPTSLYIQVSPSDIKIPLFIYSLFMVWWFVVIKFGHLINNKIRLLLNMPIYIGAAYIFYNIIIYTKYTVNLYLFWIIFLWLYGICIFLILRKLKRNESIIQLNFLNLLLITYILTLFNYGWDYRGPDWLHNTISIFLFTITFGCAIYVCIKFECWNKSSVETNSNTLK